MTENNAIQILVQGGAVGIALASLGIIYKMATNHTKHIEDSTQRFIEAMDRNSGAWIENAKALTSLKDIINK